MAQCVPSGQRSHHGKTTASRAGRGDRRRLSAIRAEEEDGDHALAGSAARRQGGEGGARRGAAPPPGISLRGRAALIALLLTCLSLIVAYWALWYTVRPLVASDTRPAYVEFEQAFPLADAWLALYLRGAVAALARRQPAALLWLLAGGGAGLYLCGMDVLYDLEHGIWGQGAGGALEVAINALTLAGSAGVPRWSWRRRAALLQG